MSVRPPQSRIWPKIFAARGDGPGQGISPLCVTPPRFCTPPRESEHGDAKKTNHGFRVQIEEMFKETDSGQRLSSQKISVKQVSVNNEEALAGIMKEINNEVESFQTLYNNQWLSKKSKPSDATKPMLHRTKSDGLANIIEVDEFPLKDAPDEDTHFTKDALNKSSRQDAARQSSKQKIREQNKELGRGINKLSSSQKTVSPSPSSTEFIANEKVQKKAGNTTSATVRSVSSLSDVERQDFKTSVGGISTQVTQTENVGTTSNSNRQAPTSEGANKPPQNEIAEAKSVDDPENALTEAERQTFKEAINAMKEETDREDKRKAAKASSKSLAARKSGSLRASKEHRKSAGAADTTKEHRKSTGIAEKAPIWSSSSIARVDVKKYNRQSSTGKVAQSQTAINKPQDVTRIPDIHAGKRRTAPEPLVKREMQEKQNAALYHGFPFAKPKSLTSIPNVKNGNFQAGFVRPVPLETGVLHVSPSAPLVSKHFSKKAMPPTLPHSKFQRRHP